MAAPFRLGIALLLLAAPAMRADEPAKTAPKSRSLDGAKLPPNAVIIISDNPRDALQNVDAVVLTPDEYQKLLDAAAEARRSAEPDKPAPPSVCRLAGRIETRGTQEVVALRAEFQFRTTAPRATVLLGLQKGKPVAATIDDGRLAVLVPLKDDDGFAVQVDAPGEHRVAVDLEAPVNSRGAKGGERGIDLGLPGAAITAIERLTLPPGIARARLGGRSYVASRFATGTEKAPALLLGPTPRLEINWDAPATAARVEPQSIVEGRYDMRVEDHTLLTRAKLTVKVQVGTIGAWEVQAPAGAEMTAEAASIEDVVRIQKPSGQGKPWVVRRDPSGADLILDLVLRTPLTPGQSTPVPGFLVARAAQQRGTITVSGPPNLRLKFDPGPGATRREAASEAGHDAVFTFFQLPESGSPLAITVQPVRGDIETHVIYQLALAEHGWRWQGKIDVRPMRTDVSALDLEVPAELQDLRPASAELVEGVAPLRDAPGGRSVVRVQLAEARRKAFTIVLEGTYPVAASASMAALPLPRLLGTIDRGGQIAANVPPGLELRGVYREWDGDKIGEWDHPLEPAPRGATGLATTVERTPARLDLTWKAPRADLLVTATADIQLGERQATVRHQWHIPAGPAAPRQFVIHGPASLAGRLRATDGGTITPTSPGVWAMQLAAPSGREAALTLAYSFPLPPADRPGSAARPVESVPLVWLEPCPRCETDVRIWSAAIPNGLLIPVGFDGPWTEIAPRAVADRPTLPTLVLHASGTQLPLGFRLAEAPAGPGTGLVVDRMWIDAVVDADGQQYYRTRCLIRPQQTHFLEVELPASPMSSQFNALLDGKRMSWTAGNGPGNRFVRLRLDPGDSGRSASVLELIYSLPPEAPQWGGWIGRLTLSPPQLRGPVFVGPVRWQIGDTANNMLVSSEGGAAFEWRWRWYRGLLAPRPAWTGAELGHWFAPDIRADLTEVGDAVWVAWQPSAAPLAFLVIGQPVALLIGSLAVVAIGLAGAYARRSAQLAAAMALTIGIAALSLYRPQVLAQLLFAAEPGLIVLVVALLVRWALLRRYRRRILFLPALARAGEPASGPLNGSSMARNGAANRNRREPTTIDAPAPQALGHE